MASLSDQQKVKVRHHLGYLNVQQDQTFVLGTPAAVETQFIIEGAMDRVLLAAVPELNRQLTILDGLEEQMVCNQENVALLKIGEITMNSTDPKNNEQTQLRKMYKYWQKSLANIMGIDSNPFDKRDSIYGGGISVSVRH